MTALKLAEWFKTLPRVIFVRPGHLELDGKTYEACYCKQPTMDTELFVKGKFVPFDAECRLDEYIFVIGEMPMKFTCDFAFTMAEIVFPELTESLPPVPGLVPVDSAEWFVSGYLLKKNITEANKSLNPFGPCFKIAPWVSPDGDKIDSMSKKPYRRLPVKFTPLKGVASWTSASSDVSSNVSKVQE